MKFLPIAIILCLLHTSCGKGSKYKVPEDVIGQDSMVEVITDVHLLQAAQRLNMQMDTADSTCLTSFSYVWKKHHITEAEYKKSLDFYTHTPSLLDSIYEKVMSNLSRQKAELQGRLFPKKK